MAVRQFTAASSEFLTMSIGNELNTFDASPVTLVMVWKATTTHAGGLFCVRSSGLWGCNPFGDGNTWFTVTGGQNGGAYSTGIWYILVFTKALFGQPRAHRYNFNTQVWTHTNFGSAQGNWTGSFPANDIVIGRWGATAEYLNGLLAVEAIYDYEMTDGQVEALLNGVPEIMEAGPIGAWRFNQTDVTTSVPDLTGNGANQSARVGTTVVTVDDPPGFQLDFGGTSFSSTDYQRAFYIEELNVNFGYALLALNRMSIDDLKYHFYKESVEA